MYYSIPIAIYIFMNFSFTDATSANEAVNLQNRLRTLSSGLVGLRNCIHDQQQQNNGPSSMDVGVTLPDNGMSSRVPDPGQPHSPLHPEPIGFSNGTSNGNGAVMNGVMVSSGAIPPIPNCSSATFTSPTMTGFHDNGITNGNQHQAHTHQFIHG